VAAEQTETAQGIRDHTEKKESVFPLFAKSLVLGVFRQQICNRGVLPENHKGSKKWIERLPERVHKIGRSKNRTYKSENKNI